MPTYTFDLDGGQGGIETVANLGSLDAAIEAAETWAKEGNWETGTETVDGIQEVVTSLSIWAEGDEEYPAISCTLRWMPDNAESLADPENHWWESERHFHEWKQSGLVYSGGGVRLSGKEQCECGAEKSWWSDNLAFGPHQGFSITYPNGPWFYIESDRKEV